MMLELFKFQFPSRRREEERNEGCKYRNRKEKEGGSGGGVVSEMRESQYQSDQSSVPLQSPDKAGTA